MRNFDFAVCNFIHRDDICILLKIKNKRTFHNCHGRAIYITLIQKLLCFVTAFYIIFGFYVYGSSNGISLIRGNTLERDHRFEQGFGLICQNKCFYVSEILDLFVFVFKKICDTTMYSISNVGQTSVGFLRYK